MNTVNTVAEIIANAIKSVGKSNTLIQHNAVTTRALIELAATVGIAAELRGIRSEWILIIDDSSHGIPGTRAKQHEKLAHEIRERQIENLMRVRLYDHD